MNNSYEELITIRDKLFDKVKKFEADHDKDPEDVLDIPMTDGQYYNCLNDLGDLCKTIASKFDQEV